MSPNATNDRAGRRLHRQFQAGRSRAFREEELYDLLTGAKYPARNPLQNVNDLKAQIAANEKACRSCARWWRSSAARGPGLHGPRAGQRRRKRAARHRPAARFRIFLRDGPGHRDQGEDHGRQGEARGDRRFHRHLAAAAHQLQRARAGDARGRALRLPRHGRRRHPDERRLPAPDPASSSPKLDAVAGISGGRRRRQRGNLAGGDQLPVRRARRSPRRRAR